MCTEFQWILVLFFRVKIVSLLFIKTMIFSSLVSTWRRKCFYFLVDEREIRIRTDFELTVRDKTNEYNGENQTQSPHDGLVFHFSQISLIRFDFGDLILRSILDDRNISPLFQIRQLFSSSSSIWFLFFPKKNPDEQRFYTKYKLEITDLRMLYIHSNNFSSSSKQQRFFVLRPTSLIDIDFNRPSLPK